MSSELRNRMVRAAQGASIVPYLEVKISGRNPLSNKCHENVQTFVEENSGYVHVRGWLRSGGALDKHSVVKSPDGSLFDITPLRQATPFFEHPGELIEYQKLDNQVFLILNSL